LLEQVLVMTGKPLNEVLLVFDLDQVHDVLSLTSATSGGARWGGIGGVD
jgi:hypothetical protein